jgi:hypothetical protein
MIDNNVFSNALHCVYLIVLMILNQINFSKCSSSNQLQNFEIVKHEFGYIISVSRFLVSRVNSLGVGTRRRQLGMILSINTGLSSHGLLLVLNVLHYHIAVIVEDIMAFGVGVCFDFEAF